MISNTLKAAPYRTRFPYLSLLNSWKWNIFPIIALCLHFLQWVSPCVHAATPLDPSLVKKINELFESYSGNDCPGASIAIVKEGQITYQQGYGMANLEYDIPNTPQTVFHVASVSKQFTCFAILLLEADGKLSLDDDIRKYIRWFPDLGYRITLRHLIHHTSGIRDQWALLGMAEIRMDDVINMAHLRRFLARQRELNFEPGSEFLYCNSGFTLLADVVSQVSGKSFKAFCEERIFEPLDMRNTHFHDDQGHRIPGRAYSYFPAGNGYRKAGLTFANVGATGLMTTAEDMARWITNLDTGELGGTRVRDFMKENGTLSDGTPIHYGFGLAFGNHKGVPLISHSGADAGFRSYAGRSPEQGIGIIVLGNRSDLKPEALARKIFDHLLENMIEPVDKTTQTTPAPKDNTPPTTEPNSLVLDETDLKPYEGHFAFRDSDEVISLRIRNKALWATHLGEWAQLTPVEKTIFRNDKANWKITFNDLVSDKAQSIHRERENEEFGTANRIPDVEWRAFLKARTGRYYSPELDKSYRIRVVGDQLEFVLPRFSDFELLRVAGNKFGQANNYSFRDIVFEQDATSGEVTGFRVSNDRVRHLLFVKENELPPIESWIECEGVYGGHLQGVATDEDFIYWSHTVQLVKTDLTGKVLSKIDVASHHGDLTYHDGKIFVAVELGSFNRPPGESDPWVYVYDAETLGFLSKHPVPALVHGCGGIAYHDGRFILVGGLPGDHQKNHLFEYDDQFHLKARHDLPTGQTRLGIQTAGYMDGHWWFGCYGSPDNPGLLKVNKDFRLVGTSTANFSYGVARLNGNTVLQGETFENGRRGKLRLLHQAPSTQPSRTSQIRVAAYNVLFGIWAEPAYVGEMFKDYNLDVIGFSEVPDGDWTARVGQILGMHHVYVGKISSANHKDKYKSILSRTPLANPHEMEIKGQGWSPASLVGADTIIRGLPVRVYSTHIPGQAEADRSAAAFLAESILPSSKKTTRHLILLGDLNNRPGEDPLLRIEACGMRSMWDDLGINTNPLSTHQHIETGRESGVIDHIYYDSPSNARAIEGGVIYNAFNPPHTKKDMSRYQSEWNQYGKPLSDHRPVWAVIELNTAP